MKTDKKEQNKIDIHANDREKVKDRAIYLL